MYQENNNTGSNPWEMPPQPEPAPEPPAKKGWTGGKLIALALCCAILGGLIGAAGVYLAASPHPSAGNNSQYLQGKRETSVLELNEIDTSKKMTAAEVYAKNVNSTVGITTSITTNFWGYQTTSAASGSGFILTDDGYILTNHHVIDGSSSITVSLYDGTTYEAELVGFNAPNDIAVLKVEAEDLVPVILGDSDSLNVGDDVLAIGNPLGELTFSLTSGAVSAKDREITMQSGSSMNLIQTDCAINSGNSGGALFNLYGEVVGITNAKYSGSSGGGATIDNIGFAIPINHVMGMVKSIIEKGYVSEAYVGISVTDVSPESQAYGLPEGAAVRAVDPEGPAGKAGIEKNDIIIEVDGKSVQGSSQLVATVKEHKPGDKIEFRIYRKGKDLTVTVEVGEQIQTMDGSTQR